jgi:hypothetical protein
MHKAVPCAYGGFVWHLQKSMNVTIQGELYQPVKKQRLSDHWV